MVWLLVVWVLLIVAVWFLAIRDGLFKSHTKRPPYAKRRIRGSISIELGRKDHDLSDVDGLPESYKDHDLFDVDGLPGSYWLGEVDLQDSDGDVGEILKQQVGSRPGSVAGKRFPAGKRWNFARNLSLIHPKRFQKSMVSIVAVVIYRSSERPQALSLVSSTDSIQDTRLDEIPPETLCRVAMEGSDMEFSDSITFRYGGRDFKRFDFLAKPKSIASHGASFLTVRIENAETGETYKSEAFEIFIADYAFANVTHSQLSALSTLISAAGAAGMFAATYFGRMDAALGVPAGSSFAVLAAVIQARFHWLFRRPITREMT